MTTQIANIPHIQW